MNTLLKAILKELADLAIVGQDVVGKQALAVILGALLQAGTDAPNIVSNIGDFKNELAALLVNPAADADLLAYATSLVSGDSVKAQGIIAAAVKLALDVGLDLDALIKSFAAPAAVTAQATVAPAAATT